MLTPLETVGLWIGIIIGIPTILFNIYKYRNLLLIPLKWCVTISKNIKAKIRNSLYAMTKHVQTQYNHLKIKIGKRWEILVGIESLKTKHSSKIEELTADHKNEVSVLQKEIESLKTKHSSKIEELTADHKNEVSVLQKEIDYLKYEKIRRGQTLLEFNEERIKFSEGYIKKIIK